MLCVRNIDGGDVETENTYVLTGYLFQQLNVVRELKQF
jgi:hypothetical protein